MNNILKAIKDFLGLGTYDLTKRIKVLSSTPNIDAHYGPYASLDEAKDTLKNVLKPSAIGRTIGVVSNNKVTEYWYQPVLDDKGKLTIDDDGNTICDFVLKQCVDLDDVEVTRIPASFIDDLFDDDPNNPTIDTDYLSGQTGSTEGEGSDFIPLPPDPVMDPEAMGGTEE